MFSKLLNWGEKLLLATSQFFDYLNNTLIEIFDDQNIDWLADALEWLIGFLGALPEFLTLFGDELLSFTFETPLFDLIILSIPVYLGYQLIIWILNIVT